MYCVRQIDLTHPVYSCGYKHLRRFVVRDYFNIYTVVYTRACHMSSFRKVQLITWRVNAAVASNQKVLFRTRNHDIILNGYNCCSRFASSIRTRNFTFEISYLSQNVAFAKETAAKPAPRLSSRDARSLTHVTTSRIRRRTHGGV